MIESLRSPEQADIVDPSSSNFVLIVSREGVSSYEFTLDRGYLTGAEIMNSQEESELAVRLKARCDANQDIMLSGSRVSPSEIPEQRFYGGDIIDFLPSN